ncbi:MAG: transcription termination/antitermination factor NusG [Planctomycetes bacterium]|nr:transcription termination/antitermination factor NusG [Planctomycetota bacterium]
MSMNWYVVRVPTNQEDKVRERLLRRIKADGLEDRLPQVLVPIERITEIKAGKKKVSSHKIYPGYVLLQADMGKHEPDEKSEEDQRVWFALRETKGFGDFVGGGAEPVAMSDEEVAQLLARMDDTAETPRMAVAVKVGDLVRIKEGPFEGFDGTVEESVDDKGLLKISVTIFGRATSVEIQQWQVEAT